MALCHGCTAEQPGAGRLPGRVPIQPLYILLWSWRPSVGGLTPSATRVRRRQSLVEPLDTVGGHRYVQLRPSATLVLHREENLLYHRLFPSGLDCTLDRYVHTGDFLIAHTIGMTTQATFCHCPGIRHNVKPLTGASSPPPKYLSEFYETLWPTTKLSPRGVLHRMQRIP